MRARVLNMNFLGTVSALGLVAGAAPLWAQDSELAGVEGEYLGTIELAQGKREVQTGTAIPVTVVNQEEIDDRQAGTIAELVDSVPGVTVVNGTTPNGSGINIRGFGANGSYGNDQKVAIIIDGALSGSEELYRIGTQLFTDPALFREVSVIRGTVGTFEYGSGIIGGALVLETKDAADITGGEIGARFRQTLQATTNGWASSSILAWQPMETVEFLANYTVRDSDDYSDGDGNLVANTASRSDSKLVKGRFSFGDALEHSVTASWSNTYSEENSVPYDAFSGNTMFGLVNRETETNIAGLRYQWQPSGNDLIDLDVWLTYSDQTIDQEDAAGGSSALLNADHSYETTKLTAKNSMFFTTGALTHDLVAGVDIIRKERADANSAPGGVDERLAVFVVDDISIGDHWIVSPSVRAETQDLTSTDGSANYDNSALMGGLSVRYEFDNGFALFGSGAYTESMPILDDLGTPAFMTMPERSHTFEAGASYAANDVFAGGDSLAFKVNVYETRLWDVTSYTYGGRFTSSPVERVETSGVELEAGYALASGLYADLNATVSDGREQNGSTWERWRLLAGDNVRLTLGKRFGEALDVSWELNAAKSSYDYANNALAGYGVHNLRATYRPQEGALEGTEIRLGVENLFSKDYQTSLSAKEAPGRTLKLTLAKTF